MKLLILILKNKIFLFELILYKVLFSRIVNINELEYFDNVKGDSESLGGLLLELLKNFQRKLKKLNLKKYNL